MFSVSVHDSDMWDEIHLEHETVQNSLRMNRPVLEKIAEEVKKRNTKNVVFVGRGSSEHAEQYARYLFEIECGMFAEIFSPSVITHYHSDIDFSDKLVIGISQCGEAKDVFTVLKSAEQQGAIVVSVTNTDKCLMRNVGEYINLECGVEHSFTAAKSYLCQAALMMELCYLITDNSEKLQELDNISSLIQDCYGEENDIRDAIPMFRNASDIMVIGRGFSYAVALEAELKIQEASYTRGRAYSSADYQHGPISTTEKFTPFIFFLADANTDNSTIELIDKLKKDFDISTLVVTNKKQYTNLGDYSVLIPERAEGEFSLYGLAVFSQLFACILSFARGYNPDKPHGLSKVTVTY